ncbi:MAG: hypothetical protein ABJC26_16075 [Gemmatimonadaceae bacterium]
MDPIKAAAARLDAFLHTVEERFKKTPKVTTAVDGVGASFPSVYTDASKPTTFGPMADSVSSSVATSPPAVAAELGVGDTVRRNGMPSDMPMKVTRVDDGVVFATVTDNQGSREVGFAADQVDVVTKAPTEETFPTIASYQSAVAMSTAGPLSSATAANTASANVSAASASTASERPRTNSASAVSTEPTPYVAGDDSPPFIMLPDGTKQFGNAPTGPLVNVVPNKQPPVPTDFGPGATFRIKGMPTGAPMTVTRIGEGVLFAQYTDDQGTRDMPFIPGQLDLVSAAP